MLQDITTMGVVEIIGTISLVLYVILAARENPWCWPVSIVGVVCSAIVMYQARLYLDVGLQGYYFVVSAFGMWYWMRGGKRRTELQITTTPIREWVWLGLVTIAGIAILAAAISQLDLAWMPRTDVPVWDATVTVGSLGATWLLLRKRIENWLVWIVVDSLYVPLCLYKELYFFAALYGFYILACVYGWMIWRHHMKRPAV